MYATLGPHAIGSICSVAACIDLLYTLWGSGPIPSPSTHLSPAPLSVSDWHIPWKTWAGIYGLRLCALDKQSKFYLSLRGWIKQSILKIISPNYAGPNYNIYVKKLVGQIKWRQNKSCKRYIHEVLSTGNRPAHILTRAGNSGHLGECPAHDQLREDGRPDVGWPGAWDRHSAEVAGQ